MGNIKFYKSKSFWGFVSLIAFMSIYLFVMNIFVEGIAIGVWIGSIIGAAIRYKIKKTEAYLICTFSLIMIINYILFRFSLIYIQSYILIFIGLSLMILYEINGENSKYKRHKAALVLILLIAFFSIDYYQYNSNIIKDRNFRGFIRKEYNIQGKIQEEDLLGIEKLHLDDNFYIKNISGIDYFKDVKKLIIWEGKLIKDFKSISKLSKLEHLIIWYANVDDIEEIPEVEALQWLEIVYPKAGKIDSLESFPNLKRLDIQGMDFENLTGLKGPNNLERLNIGDGQIISFEGIENFSHLEKLNLYKLNIRDTSRLFDSESLKFIELQGGIINDIEYFKKMKREKGIIVKGLK